MWPGAGYTRLVRWTSFESPKADASIEALQEADGSFERHLVLYADAALELTAAEARQVAAMLLNAADALDRLQ